MLSRTDMASDAEIGAAKTAREATQAAFEKLCTMLNALAVVNGEAAYKHLIDRISQLVSEAQNAVARRMAAKKANAVKAQPAEPPVETPDIPSVEE